jgi:hypothetical protein
VKGLGSIDIDVIGKGEEYMALGGPAKTAPGVNKMKEEQLLQKLREVYRGSVIESSSFDLRDMIYAFGSPVEALMYSGLFWPEFVEIDGMVFLKGTIEDEEDYERLKEVFVKHNRDTARTEQDFNLVEVPSDLFGRRAGETTEQEDHWLADRLAEMWRARLNLLYPSRDFIVEVLEPEETGGDIGIVFFQSKG